MESGLRASRLWFPLVGAVLALMACGDDEGVNPIDGASTSTGVGGGGGSGGAEAIAVALQFEGRVRDEVFSCSETYAVGSASTDVGLNDFRLYIHDVRLRRADGEEVPLSLEQDELWQYQDVVLLDFEDRSGTCANGTEETNGVVRGTVPAGDYDGLSFKLGVPFDLNHGDASSAPSPLNLTGLFWSWNDGYKFLRLDSVSTADDTPFLVHIGSTGCMPGADGGVAACDRPNVAEIVFEGIDPLTTKVLVDYAALVADSDLSASADDIPGCMSDPSDSECLPLFTHLGIDSADGSPRPDQQSFFRID
ncbi:MbnP family copper-binding protein [Sorangium sp. So ce117]|uniref:MbnP family copper-binding protein n=1 Tax=Sorangium sp. So ce117 TaxID=3133277 RepID=UPI003F618E50